MNVYLCPKWTGILLKSILLLDKGWVVDIMYDAASQASRQVKQ